MIATSDRDAAPQSPMYDEMELAQSAVDRLQSGAFDSVIEGVSGRSRLDPNVDPERPHPLRR
jgi:hypothetical protein